MPGVAVADFIRVYVVLICIPFAAILVPALLIWARDLDATARRMRQLDEQNRIVAFWENWARAISSAKGLDGWTEERAEKRIDVIMHEARLGMVEAGNEVLRIYRREEFRELREFRSTFAAFQAYRRRLPWFRRAFLLYRAPNPKARRSKILFFNYLLIPPVIFSIELPLLGPLENAGIVPRPPSFIYQWHPIVPFLGLLAFWALPSFFAWRRSRRYEDDKSCYVADGYRERLRGVRPA
jgi:hypothetical protein